MEHELYDDMVRWMRGYQRQVLNDRINPIFAELHTADDLEYLGLAREGEKQAIAERLITELTS